MGIDYLFNIAKYCLNITLVKIVIGITPLKSKVMGSSWILGQNELVLKEKITLLNFKLVNVDV